MITDWRMVDVWNTASLTPQKELVPRDYAWASELGKPLVDRYLAMKAVTPTNPPNMRSRRKFLMGNIIEEIQGIIINALGLRVDQQKEIWTHGAIPVKGKIDFLIQGIPNYTQARSFISGLGFSEEMINYLLAVVDRFEEKFAGGEFAPMVRECKSCSQYVIDHIQTGGQIVGHKLQLYHYLKGLNIPLGYVDYISKDNSLMEDCRVEQPDEALEERYNGDLIKLKEYIDTDTLPPPEPLIVFEGKFKKNFNVEYSNYLSMIYGFDRPDLYAQSVVGKIAAWNRVLKRIHDVEIGAESKTGKKTVLTDKNKIIIDQMQAEGYNAYELAKAVMIEEEDESDVI